MKISDTIKEKGFFKIDNFFTQEESTLLCDEIISCYNKNVGLSENYKWGKHFRLGPQHYSHVPNLVNIILNNKLVNSVIDDYYGKNCQRFMQTFSTWEKNSVDQSQLGRHSWLHSDPYAALKFAFFPLGATKDTGALKVVPNSREEGKNIREQFMSKNPLGMEGGIAHRMVDFKKLCPHLITRNEDEAIVLEASPRDLLILDTDTYHGGGDISINNAERIGVYIHTRP